MSHKYTEYEFDRGIPKLIYGQNLDDPGQEGNGSGKSGFTEAISILITGTMIRNGVKISELIRDGEDNLELSLTMLNTKNSKELYITRKFYKSEHKSQECSIKYGEDEIKLSRVTDYSQWILDEIGISEQDFKSYYIVTQENYNPFFSLTNLGKQQMVNRFSGADQVDKVDPFIKEDIQKEDRELRNFELLLTSLKSKRDVLQQQLEEIEEKQSKDSIEKLVEVVQEQIKTVDLELQNNEENILPKLYSELGVLDQNIKKKEEVDVEEELEEVEGKIILHNAQLDVKRSSLEEKRKEINSKVKEYRDTNVLPHKSEVLKYEGWIEEEDKNISRLQVKLETSITCPECDHKFDLREEEFDYKETLQKLEESKQKLTLHRTLLTSSTEKVQEMEKLSEEYEGILRQELNLLEDEVETLRSELQEYQQEIGRLNLSSQEVSILQNERKLLVQKVELSENKYMSLTEKKTKLLGDIERIKEGDPGVKLLREELQKKLLEVSSDLVVQEGLFFKKQEEKQEIEEWLLVFKNFKSHLANKSIRNIQDYTNLFLGSFGTNLSIKIEGYREVGGKLREQITTNVLRDGFSIGNYSRFSLGERTRLDLANILCLQELMNINSKNGLDLLICDDVLNGVDVKGVESIMSSITDIKKTIFIVTQHYIPSHSSNTITFKKQQGQTSLI